MVDYNKPAFTLTIGELIDILKDELVLEKAHDIIQKEKKVIRGIHQLAKFLEISPVTAQKWKNENRFPFVQYGRVVLFDSEKVMEAINVSKKGKR